MEGSIFSELGFQKPTTSDVNIGGLNVAMMKLHSQRSERLMLLRMSCNMAIVVANGQTKR